MLSLKKIARKGLFMVERKANMDRTSFSEPYVVSIKPTIIISIRTRNHLNVPYVVNILKQYKLSPDILIFMPETFKSNRLNVPNVVSSSAKRGT